MAGLDGFLYLAASFYRRHIGTPGSVLFAGVKVSFFSFSVNVLKIIIIRNADCPPCWYYKFAIFVDYNTGCVIQYYTDQWLCLSHVTG